VGGQSASPTDVRERVDVINALAVELRFSDLSRAVALSQEALDLASCNAPANPSYPKGQAVSMYNLGRFNTQLGRYDTALSFLFKSLSLFGQIGDLHSSAKVLNALGATYVHLCAYAEALRCFFKALEIHGDIGPDQEIAGILNNVGYVYLQLEQHSKALAYLREGLQIAQETDAKESQADALDNLCNAYYHLVDYESALRCGLESVQLFQEIGDKQGEAEVLSSVGEVYRAQGSYARALAHFRKSLHIAEKIGLRYETVAALQRIGGVHRLEGRTQVALSYLNQALAIAQEIHAKQKLYECHQALAEVYKQTGDFETALSHYESFHQIREEVFNEEADRRLKNLEVLHQVETAKREAEIYQLKNVALQQEIEERKKVQASLRQLAITDPLTGLYNRHHFFAMAEYEFKEAARHHRPISAIMLDIDHFKQVNDIYGHIVGDQVLIALGQHIRDSLSEVGIVGRFGGEEFVVLLPNIELDQAQQAAERLRQTIATHPYDTNKGPISITISLGVADVCLANRISVETLLEQADQALYSAKQAGRNRTVVSGKDGHRATTAPPQSKSRVQLWAPD